MKMFNTKLILLIMSIFLIAGCSGGDGSKGVVSVESLLITVPDNISPTAEVSESEQTVTQGDTVTLDASNSTDEDGSIVLYQWQLVDGTVVGEGETVTYNTSSLEAGTYTLRLVVTDDVGATGVVEFTLTIEEQPKPEPSPSPSPSPEPSPSSSPEPSPSPSPTPELDPTLDVLCENPITHNGTDYCTVVSPYTGKVWLDRNLGAAQVCTSFDDMACYGDYYQWGRNFDGHEDSTSGVTNVQATDVNDAGSDFITDDGTNDFDWAKTADTDASLRQANWSKTDGSSVCPVGFRVPSIIELRVETLDNGVIDRETAFSNFLKLPSAGSRYYRNGSLGGIGSWGSVWAGSVDGSKSSGVAFDRYGASWVPTERARGFSVRCLRD